MSDTVDPPEIAALRAAVNVSPGNAPLRQLLGDVLLKYNFFDAAILEYREVLRQDPRNVQAKFHLACAFRALGKNPEAVVLLEDVLATEQGPGVAHLLYARILCDNAELQKAAKHARRARALDPAAVDPDLDSRLEIFLRPLGLENESAPKPPASDENGDADDQGRVRVRTGNNPGLFEGDIERPTVTFNDVGGMDGVKEQIRMKIIHPLAHAGLFKAYGKKIGGGVLLYGPPGCGKTHLARATAGEVKASFISVGLHQVLDMWIGNSEKNLHALFEQARRNSPTVLFIDEVDALAANRTDLRHSAGRNVINQFLAELDGLDASNEGLLILAATNAPWHLDPAFRRPGRFGDIVFVPPPDAPARTAILRVLLRGKPAVNIDFDAVAQKTARFSGADLKALIDNAIEAKLATAMKTGRVDPLSARDLLAAAGQIKPTTIEWFASAKNYALYANQAGQYDEILAYLKHAR